MLRTFNCGVGMAILVDPDRVDALLAIARDAGETPFVIGRTVEAGEGAEQVRFSGRLAL
jgi:phosphoribosylformylglycinamidine cyclo-ligase